MDCLGTIRDVDLARPRPGRFLWMQKRNARRPRRGGRTVSPRVLIIDDEAEIRRNLTIGLTQEGYSCTACPDGISAIHELYNSREKGIGYDYLITDIFMPDIDGLKILKVIKTEFADLPVLVITGFGDDALEATALAEINTGYLDKPFEISDLVETMKKLSPGTTTAAVPERPEPDEPPREVVSSYVTIRIRDDDKVRDAYEALHAMAGVVSCDAVRGEVDLILLVHASSDAEMRDRHDQIRSVPGVEIVSLSKVERPTLDRDVHEFIEIYKKVVKSGERAKLPKIAGKKRYVIVDIDKNSLQRVFTSLFFLDEVIFCDMIDDGSRIIGITSASGSPDQKEGVVERLRRIDGVLRVEEAKVIEMAEF